MYISVAFSFEQNSISQYHWIQFRTGQHNLFQIYSVQFFKVFTEYYLWFQMKPQSINVSFFQWIKYYVLLKSFHLIALAYFLWCWFAHIYELFSLAFLKTKEYLFLFPLNQYLLKCILLLSYLQCNPCSLFKLFYCKVSLIVSSSVKAFKLGFGLATVARLSLQSIELSISKVI